MNEGGTQFLAADLGGRRRRRRCRDGTELPRTRWTRLLWTGEVIGTHRVGTGLFRCSARCLCLYLSANDAAKNPAECTNLDRDRPLGRTLSTPFPMSLAYAGVMKSDATRASLQLREAISAHLAQVHAVLERYDARNPRVFGSVARGDANSASDVDLLVDLDVGGNPLLRVAGMSEELSSLLGIRVDVVSDSLLREPVSSAVHADLIAL